MSDTRRVTVEYQVASEQVEELLIDAWIERQEEMILGPIHGTVEGDTSNVG